MRTAVAVTIPLLMLTACASEQASAPGAMQSLKGASLAPVTHDPARFFAMNQGRIFWASGGTITGGVVGGAITGAAADSAQGAGEKILADNGIADPTPAIVTDLMHDISSAYGVRAAPPVRGADKVHYSDIANGAAYVLDVKTLYWSLSSAPFPIKGKSHILFVAEAILADGRTNAVIAHQYCRPIWPEKGQPDVAYDAMSANGAAKLKEGLQHIRDACVDELKHKLMPN